MELLPEPIAFEWDRANIDKNFVKHKVANRETEEVFENNPKLILKDEKHSQNEIRYALFGITNNHRELFIVFTIKEDKVRVISARDMSQRERKFYGHEIKKHTQI